MIRHCTSSDPNLGYTKTGRREWCGRTFDDVDHSTICPHDRLPPKLSLEELERMVADLHQQSPHRLTTDEIILRYLAPPSA